jgi:hypothetical protein
MNTLNKKQTSVIAVITALVIVMAISPIVLNANNQAFAGGNNHHHKHHHHHHHHSSSGKHNSASQGITQAQSNRQNSQCVSGVATVGSCNNGSVQGQVNIGNNALGQQ